MIMINIGKLDEKYTIKIAKLCLNESYDWKKQTVVEFKVVENGQVEYYKMKMKMQVEIVGLLQSPENGRILRNSGVIDN